MGIKILSEHGYDEAILGLSLSYGIAVDRAKEVALKLAVKDGGHNKFLESIYIWLDVTAPRFWWQEADTYRLSTKQSESTMHTIQKEFLDNGDFEYPIHPQILDYINSLIQQYKITKSINDLLILKNSLPEGFLQRRIWVMNYKCLRNILMQRRNHRLPQWKLFCDYIMKNIKYPELLGDI